MPSNNPELRKQIEDMGLNFDVLEFFALLKRRNFFGQTNIKWEGGTPVNIKKLIGDITENIKVSDLRRDLK